MIQLQREYEAALIVVQQWHAQFQPKAIRPMRQIKDREVLAAITHLEHISTRLSDKAADISALVARTEQRLNQGAGAWTALDEL